jgi:hypothetical protein
MQHVKPAENPQMQLGLSQLQHIQSGGVSGMPDTQSP